jgi:hypothetical protein
MNTNQSMTVGPEYSYCLEKVAMRESVNDWKFDNLTQFA